jgi:hypothetical protein
LHGSEGFGIGVDAAAPASDGYDTGQDCESAAPTTVVHPFAGLIATFGFRPAWSAGIPSIVPTTPEHVAAFVD